MTTTLVVRQTLGAPETTAPTDSKLSLVKIIPRPSKSLGAATSLSDDLKQERRCDVVVLVDKFDESRTAIETRLGRKKNGP